MGSIWATINARFRTEVQMQKDVDSHLQSMVDARLVATTVGKRAQWVQLMTYLLGWLLVIVVTLVLAGAVLMVGDGWTLAGCAVLGVLALAVFKNPYC